MPLKLIHRPFAARRMHPEVMKEIRKAYGDMARKAIAALHDPIMNWDHKPRFIVRIIVNTSRWQFTVKVDRRTTGGKRYTWADLGTGVRGGGESYIITPRDDDGTLRFEIPSHPKTPPSGPINQLPPGVYHAKAVEHPGIWPRGWSEEFYDKMSDRNRTTSQIPPGFRAVTEAAIKRAYRRLGIY